MSVKWMRSFGNVLYSEFCLLRTEVLLFWRPTRAEYRLVRLSNFCCN